MPNGNLLAHRTPALGQRNLMSPLPFPARAPAAPAPGQFPGGGAVPGRFPGGGAVAGQFPGGRRAGVPLLGPGASLTAPGSVPAPGPRPPIAAEQMLAMALQRRPSSAGQGSSVLTPEETGELSTLVTPRLAQLLTKAFPNAASLLAPFVGGGSAGQVPAVGPQLGPVPRLGPVGQPGGGQAAALAQLLMAPPRGAAVPTGSPPPGALASPRGLPPPRRF